MARTLPRRKLPTGTVTFLFSDIAGSTRLAGELGPTAYRRLLEQHNRVLRDAFNAHGGVERGTQGDAFLVIFRDAPSAIVAALEAQRALAAARWPGGADVNVRMGLHSGEGIPGGDDYVGLDINRAARIASAANGGQILLSDATRALSERELPENASIRDVGRHRLRDLEQPERLFQLIADDLPSDFPALQTSDGPPGNLPLRVTSFIGREQELADLQALLAEHRLVTISGPGGTGKTSLSVEVARAASHYFPDGAWFVALEAIDDPELVPAAVVSALGLREVGIRGPLELLRDHLRERRLLLVLDNFERLLDAADLVRGLLQEAPELRILVTSRARLHMAGEQEYRLSPLPVPAPVGDDGLDLAALEKVDCVRLFVDRARRTEAAFRITADVAGPVVETCRRLDGLPLGIELAAARIGFLAPAAIAERLARRLPLPGAGVRDLPDRQQTIAEAIGWSYELLDPSGRQLLARLSVFSSGWDLEAAEAVCGSWSDIDADVIEALAGLVDQSLVRALTAGPATRFTMLETIRDFAADRLAESHDLTETSRRHAEHYLFLAESAARHLPGRTQVAWLQRLGQERDNLRAAIQWAIETGATQTGLRFVAALWRFWQLGGQMAEGLAKTRTVFGLDGSNEPTLVRMRALEASGGLFYWSGNPGLAAGLYEQQVALARQLGDKGGEADALFNLAATTSQAGDLAGAFATADRAHILYEELGDRRGQARVDGLRGIGLMVAGDTARALETMLRSIEQFRTVDDPYFEAVTLATSAWSRFMLAKTREGLPDWREAIELAHSLGDIASTTFALEFAAIVALDSGRHEESAAIRGAFEEACRLYGVRPPRATEELVARSGYLDELKAVLGQERYAASAERGRRMTLGEAVEFAVGVVRTIEADA
jgi:predicted ATPase/class 3 adenylate cyclase